MKTPPWSVQSRTTSRSSEPAEGSKCLANNRQQLCESQELKTPQTATVARELAGGFRGGVEGENRKILPLQKREGIW